MPRPRGRSCSTRRSVSEGTTFHPRRRGRHGRSLSRKRSRMGSAKPPRQRRVASTRPTRSRPLRSSRPRPSRSSLRLESRPQTRPRQRTKRRSRRSRRRRRRRESGHRRRPPNSRNKTVSTHLCVAIGSSLPAATMPRLPVASQRALRIAGYAGCALAAVAIFLLIQQRGLGRNYGSYDFYAYLTAASHLVGGESLYPQLALPSFELGDQGLYLYPPPIAILFVPLLALPFATASAIWATALTLPFLLRDWLDWLVVLSRLVGGPPTSSNLLPTVFLQWPGRGLVLGFAIASLGVAAAALYRPARLYKEFPLAISLAAAPFVSAFVFYPYLLFALPLVVLLIFGDVPAWVRAAGAVSWMLLELEAIAPLRGIGVAAVAIALAVGLALAAGARRAVAVPISAEKIGQPA